MVKFIQILLEICGSINKDH